MNKNQFIYSIITKESRGREEDNVIPRSAGKVTNNAFTHRLCVYSRLLEPVFDGRWMLYTDLKKETYKIHHPMEQSMFSDLWFCSSGNEGGRSEGSRWHHGTTTTTTTMTDVVFRFAGKDYPRWISVFIVSNSILGKLAMFLVCLLVVPSRDQCMECMYTKMK